MAGAVFLIHILGLALLFTGPHPGAPAIGLALSAYLFGLRHAFDADHITAVDDTVRFLLQLGRSPLAVGFFFSLGHSTIVLIATVLLTLSTSRFDHALPFMQQVGGIFGTAFSGGFLMWIGALNLRAATQLLQISKSSGGRVAHHHEIDTVLKRRGPISRLLLRGRLRRAVDSSSRMYWVGLMFGLGFDTSSEIGLLVMSGTAATVALPFQVLLSLPILFAAGMCLVDTFDGVLMTAAYDWAGPSLPRKINYNLITTVISLVLAFTIGGIELAEVLTHLLNATEYLRLVSILNIPDLGFAIVGLFALIWCGGVTLSKRRESAHAEPPSVTEIAVGTSITRRPRTDPSVRNSRTGLPPWVFDGKPLLRPGMKDSGSG